jgi:hypothetical protein
MANPRVRSTPTLRDLPMRLHIPATLGILYFSWYEKYEPTRLVGTLGEGELSAINDDYYDARSMCRYILSIQHQKYIFELCLLQRERSSQTRRLAQTAAQQGVDGVLRSCVER